MKKIIICFFILLVGCACRKAELDYVYLASWQANNPEIPIFINNKVCKDVNDFTGGCYLKIKNQSEIKIYIPPLPEEFEVYVVCTDDLFTEKKVILKEQEYETIIKPEQYGERRVFNCGVRVSAKEGIIGFAEVRVRIYDKDYKRREIIYLNKNILIWGRYAYRGVVCYNTYCKFYKNLTYVKINKNLLFSLSYSYKGRWNYYESGL